MYKEIRIIIQVFLIYVFRKTGDLNNMFPLKKTYFDEDFYTRKYPELKKKK